MIYTFRTFWFTLFKRRGERRQGHADDARQERDAGKGDNKRKRILVR
jgi:hypothetical protein